MDLSSNLDPLKKLLDRNNKKNRLTILISIIGVILFVVIATMLPFKDQLFNYLYPKPKSQAQEVNSSMDPNDLLLLQSNNLPKNLSLSTITPTVSTTPSTSLYRNWEKITTINVPPGRYRGALAYFAPTKKLILYGGWGDGRQLSDAWEFDGARWNLLNSADIGVPPGPLTGHKMVYDEANQRIVMFGGFYLDAFNRFFYRNDTMYFKINDLWQTPMWEIATTVTKPVARQGHAMAYDSGRQRIIVFGGESFGRILLNDTWEFDGNNWRQINTPVSPSARFEPAMSYDSTRGRIVLHGGYNFDNYFLTDTWEYDSSQETWRKIADKGVDSDGDGAMAYDNSISKVVLFGGNSSGWWTSVPLDKTWELTETSWQEIFPTNHPLALRLPSMIYYPDRGRLVLFGGAYWDQQNSRWLTLSETWIYQTLPPPNPTPIPNKIQIDTSIKVQDKIQI